MNWIEVSVTVTPEAVEAVGALLLDAGAGGIVEQTRTTRVAYFPDDADTPDVIERIKHDVHRLKTFGLNPGPAEVTWRKVSETSWADAWKRFFHPLPLGERLVVRPTWRDYTPKPEELVIDLDPGMAFGTGSHPTTAMCARLLERRVQPGDRVMDVGTGSGILSIAAARLGAERVFACDVDRGSVAIARRNVEANGVSHVVDVVEGSWTEPMERKERADVVVANIVASVIEAMIPDAGRLLTPRGRFIASGIATYRRAGVMTALSRHGWRVTDVHTEGEWIALEAVLRDDGGDRHG